MLNPFDRHRFAPQPVYYTKIPKIEARKQVVGVYRKITGNQSIPDDRNYWTLCNWQPDVEGAEIVQLKKMGLLVDEQFFGIDNDIKEEGIIEHNKKCHPRANWFKGDWLEVIDEHYEKFKPSLVFFDYTRSVVVVSSHIIVARTMNMCPPGTMVAANLMLSDGHSKRKFDPNTLIENLGSHLRYSDWQVLDRYYSYRSSQTDMATFIFYKHA